MSEDKGNARYVINAHAPGRVTINHSVYTRSLVIGPQRLVAEWRPRNLDEACRTYTVLMAEQRRVVAALLLAD
ncbi:MAG: hypothetical protein P8Z69_06930 [Acidihalobacter sp.]